MEGLITRLKTSCIAVLIKLLFEFSRFFNLQNVVKIELIPQHARGGGVGVLLSGCILFCSQVDRPITGWRGPYKRTFTV